MGAKKNGETNGIRNSDKRRAHSRILSIDLIRGFSIVFMVLVHFGIFLGNEDASQNAAVNFLDHCLADWGAAVFLMTMGMSQVLSARRIGKPDNWLLFKRALVRGIYIFGVGIVMLALAWGPDQIWGWDILTLMGVGTIVLFFCRFLPSWSLIGVIGAIMVLTPWFRGVFNIHWSEFQDLPCPHAATCHEFEHQPVPWVLGPENDFVNHVLFQNP